MRFESFENKDDNEGKEFGQKIFSDIEQRVMSSVISGRLRKEIQDKKPKHYPPTMFVALDHSADDNDIANMLEMASEDFGSEMPENVALRSMVSIHPPINDNMHEVMHELGMTLREDAVCMFLILEQQRMERSEEDYDSEPFNPQPFLTIASCTLDGRHAFQVMPITYEGENEDEMTLGPSEWHEHESPPLQSFWKGYMTGLAHRIGIIKKD